MYQMVTKISFFFFFLPGRLMTIVQLIVTIWNCSITLERSSIFENRKSSISIRAFNRSVKLRVLVVLLESLWVISMFLEDLRWFQHDNFFPNFRGPSHWGGNDLMLWWIHRLCLYWGWFVVGVTTFVPHESWYGTKLPSWYIQHFFNAGNPGEAT